MFGDAYYNLKNFNEAIKSYQQVTNKFPASKQYVPALYAQAVAYQRISNFDAATEIYQKVVKDHPKRIEADEQLYYEQNALRANLLYSEEELFSTGKLTFLSTISH